MKHEVLCGDSGLMKCGVKVARWALLIASIGYIRRGRSVGGQPFNGIKDASKAFIDAMQLNPDQISLISFTNTATTHNQLTYNGAAVKSSIDGLSANGTTYIGAGITAAQNELFSVRGNTNATKTIIVPSDGIDTTGPANGTQNAADAAKAAGIRIVSIAWGSANTTVMQGLASSAADYYAAPTATQLGAVYDSIAGSLCRPPNQAPLVSGGSGQTITLPSTATLNGSVSDDGLPINSALTIAWTKVSGPGTVSFSNASAAVNVASFSLSGTYVLRLTASDTLLSASSDVTVVVNQAAGSPYSLTLSPATAGPNVLGTSQSLTATLRDPAGVAVSGTSVTFTVSGAHSSTQSVTTNAQGVASFSYTGSANGTDSVAAATTAHGGVTATPARVGWVTPVQGISATSILGRFFVSDGTGVFKTPGNQQPVFSQWFPTLNFNPPAANVPGNASGINTGSRPFTNLTTDVNGNYNGLIIAQGNGYEAGVGLLHHFNGVFTGKFLVAEAGQKTFNFFTDDGFILGVGGGATRVSGANFNAPADGLTAFERLQLMGAYNGGTAPVGNQITVNFPAAGTYPFEVDYSECCGGPLVLNMTIVNGVGGNRSCR